MEYITVIIMLILFFVIMLLIFTNFILPNIINIFRAKKMKKLAERLNLQYFKFKKEKDKEGNDFKKKNVIGGVYNGKRIEIFDYDTKTNYYSDAAEILQTTAGIVAGGDTSLSLTYINGKFYKNAFLPYLSIKKLEEFIIGEVKLKEYVKVNFNKELFIIILILSLFISIIIYNFWFDVLNMILLWFLIVIQNIIFIFIGYILARRAKYIINIR